ncbi:MAG: hypothetical protein QUU85_15815 [Candidatus Eisenbacteria bacterium]|nr:hypothetical protein [Candidatus Eisenbacteria bacterium]
MLDFLTYLAGLLVAGAWIRFRPVRSLGRVLLLWLGGVLAARVLPGMGSALIDRDPRALSVLLVLLEGFGGVALLVALWTVAHADRPARRLRWKQVAFVVSLVLAGAAPKAWFLFVPPALPLMLSFRWRDRLGAGGLLLANGVALITFLTGTLHFSSDPEDFRRSMEGLIHFSSHLSILTGLYALMSLPMTGSRVHLSIRRIGRRLIGSHLLAALIPFVLGALFLLLSGALYLSTYRCLVTARLMKEEAEAVRARMAASVAAGVSVPERPFGSSSPAQAVVWQGADGVVHAWGDTLAIPPDSLLANRQPSSDVPLLWDGRRLWLRARLDSVAAGPDAPARIEALAQVDSMWMARLSRSVGQPVQVRPRLFVASTGVGVSIGSDDEIERAIREADGGAPRPGERGIPDPSGKGDVPDPREGGTVPLLSLIHI